MAAPMNDVQRLEKSLLGHMGRAIADHRLIEAGDDDRHLDGAGALTVGSREPGCLFDGAQRIWARGSRGQTL